MALDFPSSPTNGQTFTSGSRSWTYNSTTSSWESASPTISPQIANYVYAAPNGSSGAPTFRALVGADLPTSSVLRDTNLNIAVNNIDYGYSTVATAAGTTTLTAASPYYLYFTGSTTQTVVMPVTSTLAAGLSYHICNNSTGNITVNSSGGNLIGTILPGTTIHITCIGTTLTTAADWDFGFTDFGTVTGTGSVVMSANPTLSGTVNVAALTASGAISTSSSLATSSTATVSLIGSGTITIGGTASSAAITLGQSNATQTVNIATGPAASTKVATVNIGTGGLTGSTTTITIGNATAGATSTTLMNGTVTFANAAATRTALGAGTVTSVGGTGTVSGLTLTGTVTSSGNLTLGGTLSLTSGNITTGLGYTPANRAGDTFTGPVIVNGSQTVGQFQAVGGSASTWYNYILRNDGSDFWLLSSAVQTTQAAAVGATWSTLRPFRTNPSSGAVWINSDNASDAYFGGKRYDNSNTAYYIKPAGTSYINALNIGPTAGGTSYLNINGYNAYGGTGYHGFLTLYNTYASATNPYQYWRINAAGGWEIVNSAYNAVLFTFTQGGDLTASGNLTAYSDRKLKNNFEPISSAIAKVMKLHGVTFTRIDKEDLTKRYAGLIAQDVEAVLPEAVEINDTISYGEIKSVDYNGTTALLVEAIKEQQAHISKLEEKLNKVLGE